MENIETAAPIESVVARLAGPVELLKRSWTLFKSRLTVLLTIVLVPGVIGYLLMFAFGSYAGVDFMATPEVLQTQIMNIFMGGGSVPLFAGMGVGILIAIVLATLGKLALMYAIKEPLDFVPAYKKAWDNILSYWWMALIMIGILIPAFIVIIIPGIILGVYYSFATQIFITENIRGYAILQRSMAYVNGRWWAVFGRLLFIGILVWVITAITQGILGMLGLEMIAKVIQYLLMPLAAAYSWFLYEEVRR